MPWLLLDSSSGRSSLTYASMMDNNSTNIFHVSETGSCEPLF